MLSSCFRWHFFGTAYSLKTNLALLLSELRQPCAIDDQAIQLDYVIPGGRLSPTLSRLRCRERLPRYSPPFAAVVLLALRFSSFRPRSTPLRRMSKGQGGLYAGSISVMGGNTEADVLPGSMWDSLAWLKAQICTQ